MRRRHLLSAAPVLLAGPAWTVPVFSVQAVTFCQANLLVLQRLGRPAPFSAYVLRIKSNLSAVIGAAPAQAGATAAMVVAIKPGPEARAWLIDPSGALGGFAPGLIAAASAARPPAIRNGPIAFAIIFQAWGGGAPFPAGFPVPAAWEGGDASEIIPDGPLARIWP
jgi:hypothetical protein